jgi:(p)ppGpp synthase/HD superfamily hydrolase
MNESERLQRYIREYDSESTDKARVFSKLKHAGQLDDTGKDYYEAHIQQVHDIVLQVTDNPEILAASLLHDTLEDTNTTYEELVEIFGKRVADLVHELTHEGNKDKKGFYFPRLKSKDAILIKFADRLSNLSRMEKWKYDRQISYINKSKFWKS